MAGTGGYCLDTWSGDCYLQARYYDPTTRQFLSKDPAEADGEESAYQYCGGDPIQATDATGEAADYTGSGKITVANATANAARHTANKRLKRLLMQRAVEAERRERVHRAYVKKLANARIARQKAAAAKLRIAKAAAAKKKRAATLKAEAAAKKGCCQECRGQEVGGAGKQNESGGRYDDSRAEDRRGLAHVALCWPGMGERHVGR